MNPKVSIILATYNRARLIGETLKSIEKQTYSAFECLIIDDGSTDNTKEVLEPFLKNSRFTYHKRPGNYSKGLSGCRNYGLDLSSGDYIIFFDDDDVVHPKNLECCIYELSSKDYDFCRYQREVFNGDFHYRFDLKSEYTSFTITSTTISDIITNKLPFNSCAVMWSKDCFARKRFIEDLHYAEEWELYSRILASKKQGVSINKTLYYARKHANSNTGEFYSGNKKRLNSKIEASKLIISNLDMKNLLSPYLIHFFTWESVRFKSRELIQHLIEQSSLSSLQKFKARMQYKLGPSTQFLMRLKKRVK